jgi:hypothetical protein
MAPWFTPLLSRYDAPGREFYPPNRRLLLVILARATFQTTRRCGLERLVKPVKK